MIETTIALKAKDSDWRSEMHSAPNCDIKPIEEHVPWAFCKNPLHDPILFLSIIPLFPFFLLFRIVMQ